MQSLTYINSRGQSIQFGSSAPYLLSKFNPGKPEANIQKTRALGQDGSTVHGITIDGVFPSVEGYVMGSSREDMYLKREALSRILNPKLGIGKLIYQNDHLTREISAIPDDSPEYRDRVGDNTNFMVSFECPEPFWLETAKTVQQLTYIMGGLKFPLVLPSGFSDRTYKRVLANSGDVETPVEVEFYGPATNPTVTNNTTGEFITVKRELLATDKLIINTEFGNVRVEIGAVDGTRTNVFNWIDLSSTFFQLAVGDNELEYNSNNESSLSKVIIKYSNRFVGV